MGKRTRLICFILLLISSTAEIIIAAESDDKAISASTEVTNSNSIMEPEEAKKEIATKSTTQLTEPVNLDSVKMIVGGDSKGGVAKQVTLPVKN